MITGNSANLPKLQESMDSTDELQFFSRSRASPRRASGARIILWVLIAFLPVLALAQTTDFVPSRYDEFDNMQPHRFDWMLAYQGKPATSLVKDPHFADVNKYVVDLLKVKYDFDGHGTQVLLRDKFLEVLGGTGPGPSTPDPVRVRLGRYVTASNCLGDQCETRALLWVDSFEGIALCVLVHPPTQQLPSNGPAILIYTRQLSLKMKLLKEAYLPDQFWFDFRDWAYAKHLSPLMTQRYVNGFSAIQVMLHDGDFCLSAYSTVDAENCNQLGQDAADADLQALLSQIGSHPGEDVTDLAQLKETEDAWKNYRDKACRAAFRQFDGGTAAPVAEGECSVRLTREHVRDLQANYFMILFD
jgi:uncharacterized protein YecT (DUF1311 family)